MRALEPKAAVIGAGTMGHGIAQVFIQAGYEVKLVDVNDKALKEALQKIRVNLAFFVESGLLTLEESKEAFSRIEPMLDLEDAVSDVEFVTEAVTEDMNTKHKVFKILDAETSNRTILASNTSSLSITEIAKATEKPERVIGTNWWNPPQIVPLVEILKGKRTSDDTVQRTKETLSRVGKKPIVILKPIPGFIGNRLQFALFREALALLQSGVASAEDIDTATVYGLGFRYAILGPLRVADFGGIDVFYHISRELFKDLDCSKEPQRVLARLVQNGKLGLKSGEGFYAYGIKESKQVLMERDRKLLEVLKIRLGKKKWESDG